VLTTLVKSPSVAPLREAVSSDVMPACLEARIEATGNELKFERIHRGIPLCVRGEKGHYFPGYRWFPYPSGRDISASPGVSERPSNL